MQVFSADHYFTNNGVYTFDPRKLPQAHARCLRLFADAVRQGHDVPVDVLVLRGVPGAGKSTLLNGTMVRDELYPRFSKFTVAVDNTGTTVAEVAPYVALAAAYGHAVEVWTLLVDPSECHNVHGVPDDAVRRMDARLREETPRLPPFWTHRTITRDAAGHFVPVEG